MTFEMAALVLAWVAIVLLAFGLSGVMRQIAELRQARTGPASTGPIGVRLGTPAPWNTESGGQFPTPALLLFADSDCTSCRTVIPTLASLAEGNGTGLNYLIVLPDEDGLGTSTRSLRVVNDSGAFAAFGVELTPTAVVVDENGLIAGAELVGSPLLLQRFHAAVLDALQRKAV